MRNGIRKRNVVISGRKTSVSVEDEFWRGLKEIAFARNIKLGILVSEIDSRRQHPQPIVGHSVVRTGFLSD